MGSTVSAVKRVQFRLRAEDKGLLQLAASYEGESLSAFNRAALEAACSVIERNERFVLGREDAKVIIASFEQPLVPIEALCKAMMTAERIGTSLLKA